MPPRCLWTKIGSKVQSGSCHFPDGILRHRPLWPSNKVPTIKLSIKWNKRCRNAACFNALVYYSRPCVQSPSVFVLGQGLSLVHCCCVPLTLLFLVTKQADGMAFVRVKPCCAPLKIRFHVDRTDLWRLSLSSRLSAGDGRSPIHVDTGNLSRLSWVNRHRWNHDSPNNR